jgi:hypothetical protein
VRGAVIYCDYSCEFFDIPERSQMPREGKPLRETA